MRLVAVTVIGLVAAFFDCGSAWRIFHHGRQRMQHRHITHENSLDGEDKWFTQLLDHFNPTDSRTWKQRYFSNDEFYQPGGPVFLMIGGEGPENPVWMHQGNWIELAKTYNASLFSLEHRFYGKSKPTPSLTLPNLAFLSSEQALADLAYFITKTRFEQKLTKNRWIVFGGSYPGNLAAWARLKYPHLIHGAIASSAPVYAKVNFKDYLSSVSVSLGKSCTQAIRVSTEEIVNLVEKKDRKKLNKDLMLCDEMTFEPNDVSNLFETLAGNFEGVVQYNKGNREFEGAVGTNVTIDLVCGLLTSSPGQEYAKYRDVLKIILQAYNQTCLDFKYSKMLREFRRTDWNASAAEGGRQWLYQTCTEFGYYQTSDGDSQPFGKNFSVDFSILQCRDIFDKKFDLEFVQSAVERTNMIYGGLRLQSSNILFLNGAIDPWHVLSIAPTKRVKKISAQIESVLIPDTSHCADMYPPREMDSKDLQAARTLINSTIASWLKLSRGSKYVKSFVSTSTVL